MGRRDVPKIGGITFEFNGVGTILRVLPGLALSPLLAMKGSSDQV